jgi:serine phosphatase RsbU (regulator of sigma subunit)
MFEIIRTNQEKSASQIVDALFCAAREFVEGERQEDDITAVVVKVLDTP